MVYNDINYPFVWNHKYTFIVIIATYVFFLFFYIIANKHITTIVWMFVAIGIVALYFSGIHYFQSRWYHLSSKNFTKNLYWYSFCIHTFVMLILVLIAYLEPNWPYLEYVGANDAETFEREANILAEVIRSGEFSNIKTTLESFSPSPDNWGVQIVVGMLYSVFGSSVILAKIFYCLIASGSVLLLYKLSKLIWGENISRLAAIMWMIFPYSLFWSVVVRKEELVVFLLLLVAFYVVRAIQNNKITLTSIILVVIAITMIFLMRTIAGAICITMIITVFLFNKYKGSYIPAVSVGVLILFMSYFSIELFGDREFYIERITNPEAVYESRIRNALSGNTLADIVGTPVYVLLSWISPLPSIVYIDIYEKWHDNISHGHRHYLIAGLIIWNILSLFGLIGLWRTLKERFYQSIFIWGFVLLYVVSLGSTAMFTSIRHSYIYMPFQFILISVGLHYLYYRYYYKGMIWYFLLLFPFIFMFAWNIFRLYGKGLI
jgi:hypothetical protein